MVFLGREISEQRNYSDKIAQDIDEEVHSLEDIAYKSATDVISEHKDKLSNLAEYLMTNETAEGDDLTNILGPPTETNSNTPSVSPA